jgi:hypothetical protein
MILNSLYALMICIVSAAVAILAMILTQAGWVWGLVALSALGAMMVGARTYYKVEI